MSNFEALSEALNNAARDDIAAGSDPAEIANAMLVEGAALLMATIGRKQTSDQLVQIAARIAVEAGSDGH